MNIEVTLYNLKSYSNELHSAYLTARRDREAVRCIMESLRSIEDDAMTMVRFKLRREIEELDETLAKLKKLKLGLDKIIEVYDQCEDSVIDYGEEHEVNIFWGKAIQKFKVQPFKPTFYYTTEGIDVKITEPV